MLNGKIGEVAKHCRFDIAQAVPALLTLARDHHTRFNLKATAKLYMFFVWCNFLSLCYSWRGNGFRRLKLDNLWPHDRKMIMSRDVDRHIVVLVWRAE